MDLEIFQIYVTSFMNEPVRLYSSGNKVNGELRQQFLFSHIWLSLLTWLHIWIVDKSLSFAVLGDNGCDTRRCRGCRRHGDHNHPLLGLRPRRRGQSRPSLSFLHCRKTDKHDFVFRVRQRPEKLNTFTFYNAKCFFTTISLPLPI